LANTWTNFYPTLWKVEGFRVFGKTAISPLVTNRTWVDPGGPSEAVRIPKFQYSTAVSNIANVSSLVDAPSGVSEATVLLPLDIKKGFFFDVPYLEQESANVPLAENLVIQHSTALAAEVDTQVFTALTGTTYVLSGACNKATLVSAVQILNENNAPESDRILIVNPAAYSDVLNEGEFARADAIAGNEANRTGRILRALNLEIFMSNCLPADVDAVVMHKACLAMAILHGMDLRAFDMPRHFATGYSGRISFGRVLIDANLGVRIDRP
jgi:hypothetical protein